MAALRLSPLSSTTTTTTTTVALSPKSSPAAFSARVSQPCRHTKRCLVACYAGKRGSLPVSGVAVAGRPEIEFSAAGANVANPIIVIDNYDSFTYNLCQYMGDLGAYFEVYRNDEVTVEELKMKNPRGILISPGPGAPQDSGISLETVLKLGPSIPLFGVCMGLQCIGEAFGGKIVRSPFGVMHGKSSLVYFDEKEQDSLFYGLSNPFKAGRYHSLVIDNDTFPHDALEVTARTEDGLVMGVRHKLYKHIQGVQFHPESIITTEGKKIVQNFLTSVKHFEAFQRHTVGR